MDSGDEPVGGQWNFDADNRGAFGAAGPGDVPHAPRFEPDAITREVHRARRTRASPTTRAGSTASRGR